MKNFNFMIWIFLGGATGAVLREIGAQMIFPFFPWFPILIVNISGSFLIGLLIGYEKHLHQNIKDLGIIGFCGGFTTFSTFAHHTFKEFANGLVFSAISNIFLSLACTVFAVWCGLKLSDLLIYEQPDKIIEK